MIIQFSNFSLCHPGGIHALRKCTCTLDSSRANAIAILGANGAGKSTLLESILGLQSPSEGRILVDGMEVNRRSAGAIRRKIGMLFQNPDDQLFSLTVYEDVAFGPRNLHLPEEEVARRVQEALTATGIHQLAQRSPEALSGGEKRRAALAGVLAMAPETLLLDEPTAMLDPRGCRELAQCLNRLPAMKIIATHDLAFARSCCQECIVLDQGQIVAQGRPEEVLAHREKLQQWGLA